MIAYTATLKHPEIISLCGQRTKGREREVRGEHPSLCTPATQARTNWHFVFQAVDTV